jgi:Fur family ferric uptake transcriptional regulator
MTNPEDILIQLKATGHRMTVVRKMIVNLFTKAKAPLAAQNIIKSLSKGGRAVNKTTVYREIESLKDANLIREVNLLDGQLRYELIKESHNHSHLVCTECKQIECLPPINELSKLEKKIAQLNGFVVTRHVLEFFGACKECR